MNSKQIQSKSTIGLLVLDFSWKQFLLLQWLERLWDNLFETRVVRATEG